MNHRLPHIPNAHAALIEARRTELEHEAACTLEASRQRCSQPVIVVPDLSELADELSALEVSRQRCSQPVIVHDLPAVDGERAVEESRQRLAAARLTQR